VSGAIAIFVKTPGRSPVKTRLAAGTSVAFAEEWYARAATTVAAVAGVAADAHAATVYWAVAEPEAVGDARWSTLPTLAQGEGGLGLRMGRVHTELVRRHGSGLLLGADTPQLDARRLGDALAWCDPDAPARHALGPASDGGFWTYGGNRASALARWDAVPYSRSDTARRFRAAVGDGGEWLVLPVLTDGDDAADLVAMARELDALASPVAAQRAFAEWLRSAGREGPPETRDA
jgi:glycosyltransferase A (GT-A) superfamily protein (DUF2064 family)